MKGFTRISGNPNNMHFRTIWSLLFLTSLLGCRAPSVESSTSLHPIHYSLDLDLPGDTAATAVNQGWSRILDRLESASQLTLLLPDPRQGLLLQPLARALQRTGATCRVLIAPEAWVGDTTGARDSLSAWHLAGLLQCVNVDKVPPPLSLPQGCVIAFRNLQPTLQDDGAFSLVFADAASDSQPQVNLIAAIHGDPGLVDAFESYWQTLLTESAATQVTQTVTFTDVFAHQLDYWPPTMVDPFSARLVSLDSGLRQLARPVRIRVLAPHGMAPPLMEALDALQRRHEIDLLLLWGEADSLETELAESLFPKRLRRFPVTSGTPLVLMDGPFEDDAPSTAVRKRLVMLGQYDFLHPLSLFGGGILLQISNEVFFNLADRQWRRLWEL
jgi:hypothetical protein